MCSATAQVDDGNAPKAAPASLAAEGSSSDSASRSLSLLPNAIVNDSSENNHDEEPKIETIERMAFVQYPGTDIWWPALLLENAKDFERYARPEMERTKDATAKAKVAFQYMNAYLQSLDAPPRRVARFLGKPLADVETVEDETYTSFMENFTSVVTTFARHPHRFSNYQQYLDFHKGLDKATSILATEAGGPNNATSWVTQAEEAWRAQGEQAARGRPQQHHHAVGSPLGTNSVAAVSLAEDSLHPQQPTPSTTSRDNGRAETPVSPLPRLKHPLNDGESWDQAWKKMRFSGWSVWEDSDGTKCFKATQNGCVLTLHQAQKLAQDEYGWQPPLAVRATRNRTQPDTPPRKKFSSGVIWKKHCKPSGWKLIKAKRQTFDYYYVRPNVTVGPSGPEGILGEDYFIDPNHVLDWCHRNNDYPPTSSDESSPSAHEESSACDETTCHPAESEDDQSVQSKEDDHSSQEDIDDASARTPDGQRTRPQDPGIPLLPEDSSSQDDSSEDPYCFQVLWPKLKRAGWKYQANDTHYWIWLRPGRKWKRGLPDGGLREGHDYFTSEQAVVEYNKELDLNDQSDGETIFSSQCCNEEGTGKSVQENKKAPGESKRKRSTSSPTAGTQQTKNRKIKCAAASSTSTTSSEQGVKVEKSRNTAPWVIDPIPKELHRFCCEVGELVYSGHSYNLRKEDPNKKSTNRFSDLDSLRRHYCADLKGSFHVNPNAALADQAMFKRWVKYAFVPGTDYEQCRVRMPQHQEVSSFLQKMDYKEKKGVWIPPKSLLGILDDEYPSLPDLCRDLRWVEDLEGPRRRNAQSKLKYEEMIALRLYLAEDGFETEQSDSISQAETSVETAVTEKVANIPKNSKIKKDKIKGTPSKSSRKRSRSSSVEGTEKKPNLKKVEVGAGEKNLAPWAIKDVLNRGYPWWKLCQKLGVTYTSGGYSLPNESSRTCTPSFSSVDGVLRHFGTHGGFQIEKLSEDERWNLMERLSYANVPGQPSHWKTIRCLSIQEFELGLNMLGFSNASDGSWEVPDRFSSLNRKYPSLEALQKDLQRVPDLEPQSEGTRRRRTASGSTVLNEVQTIALRLRIATPLDRSCASSAPLDHQPMDVDNSKRSLTEDKTVGVHDINGPSDQETSQCSTMETVQDDITYIADPICDNELAWKLLQKVGCSNSGGYRQPDGTGPFESLNELAQSVLNDTIVCLDRSGKLTLEEANTLHRWLKFKNVTFLSAKENQEARYILSDSNKIYELLEKIGLRRATSGEFYCGEDGFNDGQVINLIRTIEILEELENTIQGNTKRNFRPANKEPELSRVEELALRLWAAESDEPLTLFNENDFCIESNQSEDIPFAHEESNQAMAQPGQGTPVAQVEAMLENTSLTIKDATSLPFAKNSDPRLDVADDVKDPSLEVHENDLMHPAMNASEEQGDDDACEDEFKTTGDDEGSLKTHVSYDVTFVGEPAEPANEPPNVPLMTQPPQDDVMPQMEDENINTVNLPLLTHPMQEEPPSEEICNKPADMPLMTQPPQDDVMSQMEGVAETTNEENNNTANLPLLTQPMQEDEKMSSEECEMIMGNRTPSKSEMKLPSRGCQEATSTPTPQSPWDRGFNNMSMDPQTQAEFGDLVQDETYF